MNLNWELARLIASAGAVISKYERAALSRGEGMPAEPATVGPTIYSLGYAIQTGKGGEAIAACEKLLETIEPPTKAEHLGSDGLSEIRASIHALRYALESGALNQDRPAHNGP